MNNQKEQFEPRDSDSAAHERFFRKYAVWVYGFSDNSYEPLMKQLVLVDHELHYSLRDRHQIRESVDDLPASSPADIITHRHHHLGLQSLHYCLQLVMARNIFKHFFKSLRCCPKALEAGQKANAGDQPVLATEELDKFWAIKAKDSLAFILCVPAQRAVIRNESQGIYVEDYEVESISGVGRWYADKVLRMHEWTQLSRKLGTLVDHSFSSTLGDGIASHDKRRVELEAEGAAVAFLAGATKQFPSKQHSKRRKFPTRLDKQGLRVRALKNAIRAAHRT